MENLKIPIIKAKLPAARHLSMDDYLKFVTFNLKYIPTKDSQRKRKKLLSISKPFRIK